jgi:hypothetical protein
MVVLTLVAECKCSFVSNGYRSGLKINRSALEALPHNYEVGTPNYMRLQHPQWVYIMSAVWRPGKI